MAMTPFIGVRISWLIAARNSDLAREFASAVRHGLGQFLLTAQQFRHLLLKLHQSAQPRPQQTVFKRHLDEFIQPQFKRPEHRRAVRVRRQGDAEDRRRLRGCCRSWRSRLSASASDSSQVQQQQIRRLVLQRPQRVRIIAGEADAGCRPGG